MRGPSLTTARDECANVEIAERCRSVVVCELQIDVKSRRGSTVAGTTAVARFPLFLVAKTKTSSNQELHRTFNDKGLQSVNSILT
jgi:hypothetical protein